MHHIVLALAPGEVDKGDVMRFREWARSRATKSRLIGAIAEVEAIGSPMCPRMNPTIPSARCNCGTYKLQYRRSIDSTSNST